MNRTYWFMICGTFALGPAIWSQPLKMAYGPVPPLSYRTQEGKPAGFTIDVFNEAARRARIQVQWLAAGPSLAIEQALKAKELDIVPAGMVTPDRQRMFYVSEPWWFAELSLLTRTTDGPTNVVGKRLALGSPIYRFLAEREFPGAIQIPFSNAEQAAAALCNGDADAALLMHADVHDIIFARPDTCAHSAVTVAETQAIMDLAIIARRGMEAPANRLRRRIDEMALDGTLARLAARYPAIPSSGVVKLANDLRTRYTSRLWRAIAISGICIAALALWFIRRLYRDIRARQKAQAELQRNEARLARAQRIAALGDWEIDLASGVVDLSEGARKLFPQLSGDGATGWQTFLRSVVPEDAERVRAAFERAAAGEPIDIQYSIEDGERRRYVRQLAELVSVPGNAAKVVGTIQDMTEYRQLEEQLMQSQKMESIGQLAGGVAHDFNNLLTVITGYSAKLLAQLPASDHSRTSITEIAEAAERAATLTRQLLMFSRREMIQPRIISVNDVVRNVDKMLRRLIGEDINLVLALDPDTPPIKADPGQIEQIVMNLVVNARDAMPHGGAVTIHAAKRQMAEGGSSHPDAEKSNYVQLTVTDTGVGIKPEILSRIFEPFFTTKERGKGTGLGLATVYGIVQQNGGRIQVRSEPGMGAEFEVLFPAAEHAESSEPAIVRAATDVCGDETILVVEDEGSVAKFVSDALRAAGYSVLQAHNGREALLTASEHEGPIHLLLTDVIMPQMGGRELAERFETLRPRTPIVYMSGYADRGLDSELQDQVLLKPFTSSHLLEKIRASLATAVPPECTPTRKPTILLVEDEAAIRLYTEDILFDAGYEVLSAGNAREALDVAGRSGPIELLITDVNLPNQSGPELAEALSSSRPNMKVLYTSGDTGHLHLCASGREGAAFLPKPFVPESLTAKISEVLSKR